MPNARRGKGFRGVFDGVSMKAFVVRLILVVDESDHNYVAIDQRNSPVITMISTTKRYKS